MSDLVSTETLSAVISGAKFPLWAAGYAVLFIGIYLFDRLKTIGLPDLRGLARVVAFCGLALPQLALQLAPLDHAQANEIDFRCLLAYFLVASSALTNMQFIRKATKVKPQQT